MKKLKVLVLLGVVALSLAACKKEEPANEPETKQEVVKETKEEPKQDEPVSTEKIPANQKPLTRTRICQMRRSENDR